MRIESVNRHLIIEAKDKTHAKSMGLYFGTHIGYGAFADVFIGNYKSDKVVVKVNHRSKISKHTIEQEIKVSTVLINHSHENVVKFLQMFENHNRSESWIVMAFINGDDMHQIQKRMNAPFTENIAKDYFRQLLAGLHFLHSLSIVHRDIKPHNILIARTEQNINVVKYIDFGFAKLVTVKENKAQCLSHKGSQIYMAPELMTDTETEYDAFKSDIYSLAIVLYEMLYNVLPFLTSDFGQDKKERNELMLKLKQSLIIRYPDKRDISYSAITLIENMICCDSEKRYSLQQIFDSEWLKT